MWHGLRKVPGGVKAKGAQCFVYLMEIRFQGAWAKKDDEARFCHTPLPPLHGSKA